MPAQRGGSTSAPRQKKGRILPRALTLHSLRFTSSLPAMAGGERGTPAAARPLLQDLFPSVLPLQVIPLHSRGRGVSAPSISPSPPIENPRRATSSNRPRAAKWAGSGGVRGGGGAGSGEEQRAMAYSERASSARCRVIKQAQGGGGNSEDGRRRRQNRAAQKVKKLAGAGAHRRPTPEPRCQYVLSLSSPGFLFVYFFCRVLREGLDGSGRCPLFLARLPFPSSSSCA
jgi:hypothetical protein